MTTLVLSIAVLMALLIWIRPVPAGAYIVDGDTIRVAGVSWRLTGFDAPERDQPGGGPATAALRRILKSGPALAVVRIRRDVYGRRLATIVTLRGPLSWRMALAGHGHGEGILGGAITLLARICGRGLWRAGGVVHPRHWRSSHR